MSSYGIYAKGTSIMNKTTSVTHPFTAKLPKLMRAILKETKTRRILKLREIILLEPVGSSFLRFPLPTDAQ